MSPKILLTDWIRLQMTFLVISNYPSQAGLYGCVNWIVEKHFMCFCYNEWQQTSWERHRKKLKAMSNWLLDYRECKNICTKKLLMYLEAFIMCDQLKRKSWNLSLSTKRREKTTLAISKFCMEGWTLRKALKRALSQIKNV